MYEPTRYKAFYDRGDGVVVALYFDMYWDEPQSAKEVDERADELWEQLRHVILDSHEKVES